MRILRYYRFYGRVCGNATSHDSDSLKAIKENAGGLKGIAGERLWVEFKKIITGKFADSLVKSMTDTKVMFSIGFPGVCDLEEFNRVYSANLDDVPMPITLVCALLKTQKEVGPVLFKYDEYL